MRQFRAEGERPLKVPSPPPLFSPELAGAGPSHIEKLSTIMGQLLEEADGEQYRCPECGSFGPKVSDH